MLSEQQKKAVESMDKQVLVAAAAGSGKTRVIIEHIKFLLEQGEDPEKIYAITYTNSAAQEMLSRLDDAPVFIGTIHSLANKILKASYVKTSSWIEEQAFNKLLQCINEDEHGEIDLPIIDHLLVDEFQDVSDDEADFIQYSLRAKHIFLVGDSCQSIYGFNGANYHRFMNIANDKRTTLFHLEKNYRNSPQILQHANSFLEYMHDVYRIKSIPNSEYFGIVEQEDYDVKNIGRYVSSTENYSDWFVLARTNAQADEVLTYFKNKGIPCTTFKKSQKTHDQLKEELKSNTVKVLTIHSAKGLEAKNVIVIGLNVFNDEERRVCYVACTRAKERLIIMDKKKKYPRGGRRDAGLIDDYAGPTITFGMADTLNKYFDNKMSKYVDYMDDEDLITIQDMDSIDPRYFKEGRKR